MSITALEIQEVRFGKARKDGYDPVEVDEFLERVAEEVDALQRAAADVDTLTRALTEAAARIKAAERRADEAEKKLAKLAEAPPVPEKAPEPEPVDAGISGEVIAKAFIAAQKSADALQEEARKEAERIYREAESRGRDIVRDALSEKQKTLDELARLRVSCEKFRTEYLSLLKFFEADAQKRIVAFDNAMQTPTSGNEPAAKTPSYAPANDTAYAPVEPPAREVPKPAPMPMPIQDPFAATSALSDPYAMPAYKIPLGEDDDLDIEDFR